MSSDTPAVELVQPSDFWTVQRVIDALGPSLQEAPAKSPVRFSRVWSDTRTLRAGDLFVALAGERFDAHTFVWDAVQAGASGVVVSKPESVAGLSVPAFVVVDTRVALGALGTYRRRSWKGTVVGIVGTNGKTSTKELVRAALGSRKRVHATYGNLNNLIGVPQTLLMIPHDADVAVVEMGTNQPGEVATLRAIVEPDVVVVTSIAEEHLEGLGDLAGVMREELSAADGTPVVVVPASQPDVVAEARERTHRVIAAGLDDGDVRAERWALGEDGSGEVEVDGTKIRVPLRGVHNLRNAMLAVAVARELGIALVDVARGIGAMTPPPMRSNVETIGRVLLINDAYNSNPGSARAALELLVHAGGPGARGRQRVAVLGTMLELGPTAPALHDEIARRAIDAGIDVVAGVGEYGEALRRIGAPEDRYLAAADAEAIWPALSSRLKPDAIILLKGSRGVRLERLVPRITDWAHATP
jgi:UDP-N-acetylmuramoyl-tripeptide--D-alanyl-D-alanine ligase